MDPIRRTVDVAASTEQAFEVLTTGMGTWWDAAYTPDVHFAQDHDGCRVPFGHGDWTHLLDRYRLAAEA